MSDYRWLMSMFSNGEHGFGRTVTRRVIALASYLVCVIGSDDSLPTGLMSLYEDAYGFRIVAMTSNDDGMMRRYHGDELTDESMVRHGDVRHVFMVMSSKNHGMRTFDDFFDAFLYVTSS